MAKEKLKKVLVIDDDPVLTKMVESRLKRASFKVLVFNEAAEGLQSVEEFEPDCIVLDVMMPIINGYNFCRLLKTEFSEKVKKIPVIFLTSRDDPQDVEIGLEMGADAYLTKPVDPDELLASIHQLLS